MPSVPGSGTPPHSTTPTPPYVYYVYYHYYSALLPSFFYVLSTLARKQYSPCSDLFWASYHRSLCFRDVVRSVHMHLLLAINPVIPGCGKGADENPLLLPSRHFQLLRFDTHGPPITAFVNVPCPRQTSFKTNAPLFAAFRLLERLLEYLPRPDNDYPACPSLRLCGALPLPLPRPPPLPSDGSRSQESTHFPPVMFSPNCRSFAQTNISCSARPVFLAHSIFDHPFQNGQRHVLILFRPSHKKRCVRKHNKAQFRLATPINCVLTKKNATKMQAYSLLTRS